MSGTGKLSSIINADISGDADVFRQVKCLYIRCLILSTRMDKIRNEYIILDDPIFSRTMAKSVTPSGTVTTLPLLIIYKIISGSLPAVVTQTNAIYILLKFPHK